MGYEKIVIQNGVKRSEDELLRTLSEKSRGHPRVCFRDPSLHYVPLRMTKNGCFNFVVNVQHYKDTKLKTESQVLRDIFFKKIQSKSRFYKT